jgi:3-oxoadipate enol-lactonase
MPRIETQFGTSLGYDEAGGGEAIPLVFLHGVGSDKSVWHPQLDYFGESRRTIAFDYPGYGDSDPAPAGTTRDDYASAILSAMWALGIYRAHVCGLSLGGVIAIALHHAKPDGCASLILADTFAVHPDGRAIYDRSCAASSDMPALARGRVDALLAAPADDAVRAEVVDTMARIDSESFRIGAEAVWLADQRDRAAAIGVPTLVVCGDRDTVTPPDLSYELGSLISGSTVAMIEGAGHLGNLEKAAVFNRLVEDFIAKVER